MSIPISSLTLFSLALVGQSGSQSLTLTLEAVRQAGQRNQAPVVVFDLDSTLLNNGTRSRQIFTEIAANDPNVRAFYGKLVALPDRLPYLPEEILRQAGITDPNKARFFLGGWRSRFDTDAYCQYDVPYDGAVGYVNSLHQGGATVVYLSERDASAMAAGTVESLRRYGFPILGTRAILLLRPDGRTNEASFRAEAAQAINRLGRVMATFDNEGLNANQNVQTWPQAKHYALATNSDPRRKAVLRREVVTIENFVISGAPPATFQLKPR